MKIKRYLISYSSGILRIRDRQENRFIYNISIHNQDIAETIMNKWIAKNYNIKIKLNGRCRTIQNV